MGLDGGERGDVRGGEGATHTRSLPSFLPSHTHTYVYPHIHIHRYPFFSLDIVKTKTWASVVSTFVLK